MPKYGVYQTVSEIHRGVLGTVWSARRESDPPPKDGDDPPYVVKTCKPDVDIAGADQAARAVALFLEMCELQQRLAKAAPKVWAPIHDVSRTTAEDGWGGGGPGGEGGAYAAMDGYARSAERLVSTRAPLEAASLSRLMEAALVAAKHIHETQRRPHGNLKPSNLMIAAGADGNDLRSAAILVCDPLAAPQLPEGADAATDLRGLGELLYQLVTWQPFQQRGGWPVGASASWTRLVGGAKWLALCNRLLDPNPTLAKPTFDEVETALRELNAARPAGGKKKLVLAGVAVGVLAIAAGAYVATRSGRGQTPTPGPTTPTVISLATWEALCDDYNDWLSPLLQDWNKKQTKFDDRTRAAYYAAAIPELQPVVNDIQSRGFKLDPQMLASQGGSPRERYDVLAREVPESLQTETGAKQVDEARAFVQSVKTAFFGRSSLVVRPLAEAGEAWSTAGWARAAAAVQACADAAANPSLDINAVDAAVAMRLRIREIDSVRTAIAAHAATIREKAPGDSVLETFSGWSQAHPAERLAAMKDAGDDAVASLKIALSSVRDTGANLASFLNNQERDAKWSQVCRSRFTSSTEYKALQARPASAETFPAWRLLATDVRFAMPTRDQDPRTGERSREAVLARFKALEPLATQELPAEGVNQVVAQLNKALQAMGESTPADRTTALARTRSLVEQWWSDRLMDDCDSARLVIERGQAGAYERIAGFIDAAGSMLQETIAEEQGGLQARIDRIWGDAPVGLGAAELRAAWPRLRGAKPGVSDADARPRVMTAESVLKQLRQLDEAVPAWNPPAGAGDGSLLQAMKDAGDSRRNALLKALIDSKAADGALASEAWSSADVQRVQAEFQKATQEFAEVAESANRLLTALRGGYGSQEKTPAGATVDELIAALTSSAAYASVKPGLASLESRLASLKRIESESDAPALVLAASKPDANAPEAALAAWRRLGSIRNGGWPASLAELDQEVSLAPPVLTLAKSLKDDVRPDKPALLDSIAAERKRRWKRFVARAGTVQEVEAALQSTYVRAEDSGFGITPADCTSPEDSTVLLRWKLHDLTARAGTMDDAALKPLVLEFVQASRAAGGAAATDAKALLDGLETAVNRPVDSKPVVNVTTLGPATAGWTCDPPGDASSLTFRHGSTTMTFLLVQPPGGASAYVARTELSVAQFKEIMQASEGWPKVSPFMDPAPNTNAKDTDTARIGPRAWEPDRVRQIKPPLDWLKESADFNNQHPYAPEFQSKPNDPNDRRIKAGMRAVEASPMQYLAPTAALTAARLAGCRLPTPGEWAAADSNAPPASNLRDAAWKRQFDYNGPASPGEGSFYNSIAGAFGDNPAVAPTDDRTLWFMPVDDPGAAPVQFSHVRGNVAELVLEATEADMPSAAGDIGRACAQLLQSKASQVFVIGGSALGPPASPEQSVPLAAGDRLFDSAQPGWADVGIRLAFGAQGGNLKPPSLAELVSAQIRDYAYGTKRTP